MAKAYVFYNPIAGNGQSDENLNQLRSHVTDEAVFCDMTKTEDYQNEILSMNADDYIIVSGGDGTLNRFANKIANIDVKGDILYYPAGSGNDFAREFDKQKGDKPFSIKKYLKDLPTVTVNGKESYFINGIGFGIDGYCCEVGDRLRATTTKPINYTAIAIKGLLFHYKPTNAKVTVDGKTIEYKKVWIAPTMNGKYYGGGMIPTPAQNRTNPDGKLSVMIFHGTSALKTLMIFPSIFKGEHVKHTKAVTVFEGYDITVEFNAPRSIQVDGETTLGVSSYNAKAWSIAKNKAPEKELAAN